MLRPYPRLAFLLKRKCMLWVVLGINVVSSISIIFLNKSIALDTPNVRFGTLMTLFQVLFVFLVLFSASHAGVFTCEGIDIPLHVQVSLSLAYCGYVAFNNLSLVSNSVSFYQITKILVTPLVVYMQSVLYGIHVDNRIIISLIPLIFGSALYVGTDFTVGLAGAIFAIMATISNAFFTVWGSVRQREVPKGATALHILYYQAMWSVWLLVPLALSLDDWKILFVEGIPVKTIGKILVSCICAISVNLSFFYIAGKTSPLTVNVIGYLKTLTVLSVGIYMFGDRLDLQCQIGLLCTLLGLLMYTYEKARNTSGKK